MQGCAERLRAQRMGGGGFKLTQDFGILSPETYDALNQCHSTVCSQSSSKSLNMPLKSFPRKYIIDQIAK